MHSRHSPVRRRAPGASPDRPRTSEVIPRPYTSHPQGRAFDACGHEEQQRTMHMLEQNLTEFKAENQLLGQLLQNVQADRRVLEGKLEDAGVQLEQERVRGEAARQETQNLRSQVQQLQRQISEKDTQLARARSVQKELEEMVLALNGTFNHRLPTSAGAALREGQHAGSGPHRALAPPDKHQQQVRQLEQEHHGRVRELQQQHASEVKQLEQEHQAKVARIEHEQRQGVAGMRRDMQELIAQIKAAAEAEVRRCMHSLEHQAEQQLRVLEQLDRRVSLLGAQTERLKSSTSSREQLLRSSQAESATAISSIEQRYMAAIKEAEREVTQLRCQVEGLMSDKRQLQAHLAGVQLAEGTHRLRADGALARTQRSREELLKYVEEVQLLLGVNAELQRDKVMHVEQVAAAEEAIKELRAEVGSLRLAVVEARMESSELLRSTARTRAKPVAPLGSLTPHTPEAADGDVQQLLKDSFLESQYLEQRTRALLSCARNEQLAAQKALLLQVRRMQALEAMRLSDMQELHHMGKLVDGAAAKAAAGGA